LKTNKKTQGNRDVENKHPSQKIPEILETKKVNKFNENAVQITSNILDQAEEKNVKN
jgi:hypothetical protein